MIDVAIEAAQKGGELALKYFKNTPKVNYKKDQSPVTKADIETEALIRKIISKNFPDHGLIGEELPPVNPKSPYQWIIDPIDGTRDFIRGIPYWAVFIALLEKGKPILSVAYFPATNHLLTAQKNKGAYINNHKAKVSKVKELNYAYISFGSLKRFKQKNFANQLINLSLKVAAPRSYGNLGLVYLLEGKIDILMESSGEIYDFAVPALLVSEAGGRFSDFEGNNSLTSGNGLFTNGFLHSQVLKILNS